MIRRLAGNWVWFILVLSLISSVANGATVPENPSYSDRWIEENSSVSSSPFLDLRNEGDTESPESPDPPESPSVPQVDTAGESDDQPDTSPDLTAERAEGPDTSDEQPTSAEATDDESSGERERDTPGRDPSDEARTKNKRNERSKSRRSSPETVTSMLRGLEPETPSDPVPISSMVAGTVPLHTLALSHPSLTAEISEPASDGPPTAGWWWRYRYWIIAGLVVLLITGMFFWSRRRRVKVVERSYPSAEEFFGDEVKTKRRTNVAAPDPRVRRTRSIEDEGPEKTETTTRETPSKSITDILNSYGIDDEHEALVEMYYSEGLTRHEVASQSSLGEGEVGLVLDLADRIKEETADGEGA